MKKRKIQDIIFVLIVCIAVVVISYALTVIVSSNPRWYQDLATYSVAVTALSIAMSIVVYIAKENKEKNTKIYISYSEEYAQEARRIVNLLQRESRIYSASHIYPGANIYETVPHYISECSVCYVILGNKISTFQKNEIGFMRHQSKIIIPILLNSDVKVPQYLRDKKPISYADFVHHPYIP